MSYSKEAITESVTPIPVSSQMREDRVVDPYAAGNRLQKAIIGQHVTNESVPVEPKATEEPVTLSPQVAALARKEQKFRQEQQALKVREAQLEKQAAEIADLKALKAKLDAKDYSGVESLIDYDAYTNYQLDKMSGSSPEQEALKKLSDKVDAVESAHKDDVTKRFEAAVNERRKAVTSLVDTNPEFARLKKAGKASEEAVVQHILDTWEHDSIDLSPEQAAKEVQEVLIENAKKWAALLAEEEQSPSVDDKKTLPPLKPGIKTITNNMQSPVAITRPSKPLHLMTDTERYAEARRRAEEKLSKGIK